jgi:tetratricopeptide (TPR) repeat protein
MITTRPGIRNLVRSCAFAVAAAVALGAAPRAWSAPATPAADSGREQAKAEFSKGNVAYNLGKYDEAIAHFEKAYGLSRVPEILFNLGQCYRKLWEADKKSEFGRRALHYYQALVREAPQSRVRVDADQFIAELEPAVAQAEARERQGLIDSARGAEALRLAQTFLRDGQLPDAASTADRLLHGPDNGRELLAEAYVVRGRTAARLGDALGAEAQFRRALELRPSAELTDAVPAESAAFEAARRTVAPGGLRLVQAPVGEVPAGKPSDIALTVEGDSEQMVAMLELGYRRGDGGAFVTTRSPYAPIGGAAPAGTAAGAGAGSPPIASGPRAAALVIPAAALVAGTHVEYWVRALNAQGSVLAESGTPTLPFRLQVAAPAIAAGPGAGAPASTPWFKRWWVWTIVGAVAIGGGAAAYAGTRGGGGDGLTTYMTKTQQ